MTRIMEDENEQINENDVECWGLRFSPLRVRLVNANKKTYVRLIQSVENDLQSLGKGKCFTMEPERDDKGYIYLMFFDKDDKDEFYQKHKDEKAYVDGKLTDIYEPAYIPRKMFPDGADLRNKA